MPAVVLWIYVSASLLIVIGLITIRTELPQHHGIDKLVPFGRLFFAICMGVFATEHFTLTTDIASLIPRWIPAHTFVTYLVGLGFLCGALGIAANVQARLAAALIGMTFLIFVLVMDLPAALARPDSRFGWALALRELAFSGGAFALAVSLWKPRPLLAAVPRVFVGMASVFYGVENLLHPANAPGVPLPKLTAEWIPGRVLVSYGVGAMLLVAGVCLLINRSTRVAATALGLTILVAILWIYLPMLVRAPTDVAALNYFFDTLLFCGSILLVANAASDYSRV